MKMLRTLALGLWLLIPGVLLGQRDDVYDELSSSFDHGKSAKESANSALDYIKRVYDQTTVDDIHYFVRKAKSEAEDAGSKAGNALSDASDAEDEADDIDCEDAEEESDDAEGNFQYAKSNADDAYTYLRRAEYSDDPDTIELNLKKARSYLVDAVDYLNNGLTDLNEAIDEFNDCN